MAIPKLLPINPPLPAVAPSPLPDDAHRYEVAITVFHVMKEESATWLFNSDMTLEDVGKKCTETWNIVVRFELNNSPLGEDQPVVLFDPTISRHPGQTIYPVRILGPPHASPTGHSPLVSSCKCIMY